MSMEEKFQSNTGGMSKMMWNVSEAAKSGMGGGKSLVSKMLIPAMNPQQAQLFHLHQSHTLNQRSPLNKDKPNLLDCRMPTIFQ